MSHRRPRAIPYAVMIASLALVAGAGEIHAAPWAVAADFEPETQWREPVALVSSVDGAWLYVANRASGTVSVIDVEGRCVKREQPIGSTLADLAATPDGRFLLAVDEAADRVVLVRVDGARVEVLGGVEVAGSPVAVSLAPDGATAFVSSLWSRAVTVIGLEASGADGLRLRVLGEAALPFEPRSVLAVGGGKAVVADAFGGGLAVVKGRTVESVRNLTAHNIRGLALSADGQRLLIVHQILKREARTDLQDIHWAAFISSNLRALPLSAVLDPEADPVLEGTLAHLSDLGDGAADPNGILPIPDGRIAVGLGGVNAIAFGREHGSIGHRVRVGRRPVALAKTPGSNRVFVANAFEDSVSVLTLEDSAQAVSISLGPHPEADLARRGRMLFHDARLSHDRWMSCHSCHTDGHSNGRLVDTLGDNSYGTPKRTLTLLGVGETGPWAWDGGVGVIGEQIQKSVVTTMRGYPLYQDELRAIEAFLRSLPPPPALVSSDHQDADAGAIARGSTIFRRLRCDRCHEPPTYTTPGAYDVGFSDERGRVMFNPPSLRGVGRRRSFFHDGGARSLNQVFEQFEHQLEEPLSTEELADLIAFLRSL